MSEGAYWFVRVPMGVWGCLLVSEVDNWYLRVPASVCELLLVSEVSYVCL